MCRWRSPGARGGIHEWQAEAVEIDGAWIGQRKFDEETGGLRGTGGGILVLVAVSRPATPMPPITVSPSRKSGNPPRHGRHARAVSGARSIQQARIELAGQIGHVEIAAAIGVLDAESGTRGLIGNAFGKIDAAIARTVREESGVP